MAKIDSTLFSDHKHALENQQRCSECGGVVVVKHSKHGSFRSCSNYPSCKFMQPFTSNDGHVIKALGIACPECNNELVLRQGRFGMFIGCSAYPDCQHTEKREQTKQQHDHITCPECKKGLLHKRQSRFGKYFYACDAYPKCKFVVNLKPVAGQCSKCGYTLLLEKSSAGGTSLLCANKKCQLKQNIET